MQLLEDFSKANLSIVEFCRQRQIPTGSFHNWRKKYQRVPAAAVMRSVPFAEVLVSASTAPGLFAEVGAIRIYQPVDPAYLKALL